MRDHRAGHVWTVTGGDGGAQPESHGDSSLLWPLICKVTHVLGLKRSFL